MLLAIIICSIHLVPHHSIANKSINKKLPSDDKTHPYKMFPCISSQNNKKKVQIPVIY